MGRKVNKGWETERCFSTILLGDGNDDDDDLFFVVFFDWEDKRIN